MKTSMQVFVMGFMSTGVCQSWDEFFYQRERERESERGKSQPDHIGIDGA